MHITFFSKDTKPEPWVNALRQQLPEARVEAWAAGAEPADYAVVRLRRRTFWTHSPGSKASSTLARGWMR